MVQPARVLFYYTGVHMDTGSPNSLLRTVRSLDRRRFTPLFLAGAGGPLTDELAAEGVEIVTGTSSDVSRRKPLSSLLGLLRQLRLLDALGVDLLHMHETGWNDDLVLAAWLRRIPVVLSLHNPVEVTARNVHWWIARRVVFVSQAHLASTRNLARIADKAIVVHNAIDLQRFAAGRSHRDELGLRAEHLVVGIVAQLSHRKGIDLLLDTAALLIPRHPELVFLVVGPPAGGEEVFAEQCTTRAAEPAFEGRLRFLGSRSRADVPNFMATCDVFLLPTRAEPFGNVLVEAMASGLPVVASAVGGIPEIVTSPAIGRLVDQLTPRAFAEALEAVIALPDRGRSMGALARASLPGRFDLATFGARWQEIYGEVLAGRPVAGEA